MMPAYKIKLTRKCAMCKIKNAVYEVYTTHNEEIGQFCQHCANKKLEHLNGASTK